MVDCQSLIGMVALVTGGSRGLGASAAIALAQAGADIAVNYLSREKEALQVQTARRELEIKKMTRAGKYRLISSGMNEFPHICCMKSE